MTFVACYLPMLMPGEKDPTRGRFQTRKAAEKYIRSRACKACKKDNEFSGCEAEWVIVPEDKFKKAKSYEDLMEAAGFKIVDNKNK